MFFYMPFILTLKCEMFSHGSDIAYKLMLKHLGPSRYREDTIVIMPAQLRKSFFNIQSLRYNLLFPIPHM